MRFLGLNVAAAMLLAGCQNRDEGAEPPPVDRPPTGGIEGPSPAQQNVADGLAANWDLRLSDEGIALALMPKSRRAAIRFFCPAGGRRLIVNVPAFRPIASEERLSLGSGGDAVALVADSRGDRQRGGVTGVGEVPADLGALVAGPLSASYGAQRSGPHPPPPRALSRAFLAACRDGAAPARGPAAPVSGPTNPCLIQDGKPLRSPALRAVGTEPFWGARIEGRCVSYSHPKDQDGTRVWTRFTPAPQGGGAWVGALSGKRFELRTRARPGCSDGMSDKSYPLAVELLVGGERRRGCAEPI